MATNEQVEWLSVTAAAQYIGASRPTLHKYVQLGYIPSYTAPNGRPRFRRTDLDAIFTENQG